MLGKNVNYEKIYTEGITKITADDFVYAKAMGRSIKLLAMSKVTEAGNIAMVAPCMIDGENPLYMVNGVFNAVLVKGNMLGDSMYYGRGAGKLPTASAVVSDVIECARNQGRFLPCFWDAEDAALADISELKRRFFVRAAKTAAEALEDRLPRRPPGRQVPQLGHLPLARGLPRHSRVAVERGADPLLEGSRRICQGARRPRCL